MPRKRTKPPAHKQPKIALHRATGQAYVRLGGHMHYLGKYGDPAAHERGHQLIAEYFANGCALRPKPEEATLAELGAAYLAHAEPYYAPTEYQRIKRAVDSALAIYGSTPAAQFGPNALRVVRSTWIADGLSRGYCNALAGALRRWFRWAASHELCPVTVHQALATVEPLKRGRCQARETEPVRPAMLESVEAVKPFLSPVVRAMVDLQILTAARGGELCALRRGDIDTGGDTWIARPERHKSAWRGREREIYLGPKAQDVLRPYLLRPSDAHLFDPRESERMRYAACPTHRHQPVREPETDREVGDHYTKDTYGRHIARAVEVCNRTRAKEGLPPVERWTPHQLRHLAATQVRQRFGIEAAQLLCGHARADVTQVYAERDRGKALEIAAAIG